MTAAVLDDDDIGGEEEGWDDGDWLSDSWEQEDDDWGDDWNDELEEGTDMVLIKLKVEVNVPGEGYSDSTIAMLKRDMVENAEQILKETQYPLIPWLSPECVIKVSLDDGLHVSIKDVHDPQRSVMAHVQAGVSGIAVKFDGYGAGTMMPGAAEIALFELANNELRAVLWPNIRSEEPVIISLDGACEEFRVD